MIVHPHDSLRPERGNSPMPACHVTGREHLRIRQSERIMLGPPSRSARGTGVARLLASRTRWVG